MTDLVNPPAYPAQVVNGSCDDIWKKDDIWYYPGKTLLDDFVGKAMQGMVAPGSTSKRTCGNGYRMRKFICKSEAARRGIGHYTRRRRVLRSTSLQGRLTMSDRYSVPIPDGATGGRFVCGQDGVY